MTQTLVLAHQGGWDEIIVVLLPLIIFAGLLAVARRRAGELQQDDATAAETKPSDES